MSEQMMEGKDFYYNAEGYIVLTKEYHLQKGFCCGNGCTHCPYEYEAVPEPQKTTLLKQLHESRKTSS